MKNKIKNHTLKISIIGLGYVGLPLAVEFGKIFPVTGFDINKKRIEELNSGFDRTLEVNNDELKESIFIRFTDSLDDLKGSDIFIVTVPTPIDEYKRPDLTPLISASRSVGKVLSKENIVIYESTVYPGCTEEICVPILEKESGLKYNNNFYCGYSPERINPGDKEHRVSSIKKIISGSTPEITDIVQDIYDTIIKAGTFRAASMKVAEAAKVIENAQRDINIAFVNELAMLFDLMNIDTNEVLEAAGTKWNFLPFKPGLVGGHCIGVDPYYLTHKAVNIGYNPEIILAGRRINDGMGAYAANKLLKTMIKKGVVINNSRVLILGITFKENCPDIRNSRVVDIVKELKEYGCNVDIFDPWVDKNEVKLEYGLDVITDFSEVDVDKYEGIVLAVAHKKFDELNGRLSSRKGVLYDIKGVLDKKMVDARL